jgi:hypothetical protein
MTKAEAITYLTEHDRWTLEVGGKTLHRKGPTARGFGVVFQDGATLDLTGAKVTREDEALTIAWPGTKWAAVLRPEV